MVTLRTLGAIDLRDAQGNELRAILVQPRRLALLTALALSRPYGFVRRDRLAAFFWPEEGDERARAALSRAVYFLRGHLGDAVIVSRGSEEIAIDRARFASDAETFLSAVESGDHAKALSLYGGDLLPAFFASGAPGFEEWLESERNYLRSRAAAAAGSLAASEEAAGDLPLAARMARRAVELAPFDEGAVRRLLRLLDRNGDRAGAIHLFQQFTVDLDVQLGVAPAPESRALMEAIKAREQEARPAPPGPGAGPAPRAASPPPPSRRRRLRVITLTALGAVLVMLPWLPGRAGIDPFRVDVVAFTPEAPARAFRELGDTLATRLFEGLVQSGLVRTTDSAPDHSGWRLSLPLDSLTSGARRGRDAGTLVSGSWRREHGLISVHARITDRQRGGRTWDITDSGSVDSTAELIDRVRLRVAGAVAVFGSSYYAGLLPSVGAPPRIDAWREFMTGVRLDGLQQRRDAVQRFRLAVSLDSSFTWPLVHAALSATGNPDPHGALADSVFSELLAARDRLGPLERRLVEYTRAIRARNWEECYRAIRDVASIAPEQFSYTEAIRASHLHRPRGAIVALTRPVVARTLRNGGAQTYWLVLTEAYHTVGDHRRELDAVLAARRQAPSSASLLMQELRALAALGMIDQVQARVDSLLTRPREGWLTPGAALTGVAGELSAHGHEAAARETIAQAVEWFQKRPAAEAVMESHRYFMGQALYEAGHVDAADSVFRSLHQEHPGEVDYLGYLGVIAARRGDALVARHVASQLNGRPMDAPVPGEAAVVWRAAISALLGDQPETMRLLVEAYGTQGTIELHTNHDFDGMRNYAPFREFIRPKG